jgi:hypothetical protein
MREFLPAINSLLLFCFAYIFFIAQRPDQAHASHALNYHFNSIRREDFHEVFCVWSDNVGNVPAETGYILYALDGDGQSWGRRLSNARVQFKALPGYPSCNNRSQSQVDDTAIEFKFVPVSALNALCG